MYTLAQKDGMIIGSYFVFSFLCFLGSMSMHTLSFLWIGMMLFTPFLIGKRIVAYRKNVLQDQMTFLQAFKYSYLIFIFASLIFAFVQWIYFQYIDDGWFISQYTSLLTQPENISVLQAYQLSEDDINFMIESLSSMRPIDVTMQFLFFNIVIGCILSIVIAAVVKKTKS